MKKIVRRLVMMAFCVTMPFFSYAQVGEDMTSLLADPIMNSLGSWTNNGFKTNAKGDNYKPMFGGNFIEQWTASSDGSVAFLGDISIEQTLTEIPNGTYLFSAACIACQQGDETMEIEGVFLYANEGHTSVGTGNGVAERFYTQGVVTDGTLTVGFKTINPTANWIAWDNAQLYYYGDATIDVELAVAILSLQETVNAGEAYTDTIKMQLSTYSALSSAVAEAKDIILNGATVDAVKAVHEKLLAAIEAAEVSIAAYQSLTAGIGSATEVFDTYSVSDDAEFVISELEALQSAIIAATGMYEAATAGSDEVNVQISALENSRAAVIVGIEIYNCLDSLDYILGSCVVGTSYGCFSQAWMDKMEEVFVELNGYFESYKAGTMTADELLPYVESTYATFDNFWASMVTIDFSLPLNSSLFPYSADIAEEADAHDELFKGYDCPWSFGEINSDNTLNLWTYDNAGCDADYSEDGKGTANGILTWHDLVPTAWQYMRTDGTVHSLQGKPLVAVFTATADAVYIIRSSVKSIDANRVSKNRGDLRSYAYFIQNGTTTLNEVTDFVSYNYDTDPGNHYFYANLKAGDMIAITFADCRHSANGNQLSQVDTLYALGNKDEDSGYTKADAENSGLPFFNPYTPAEDWSALPVAIEKGEEVLVENKDKVGEGFAQLGAEAYANLDSIVKAAQNMYEAQLASQPEVDQMIKTIDTYIEALYASAGYGICLASDQLPIDTLVDFTDWQMLADGLYYIQDAITGNYVTAPNSDADKQSVYISALIDETMTQQNAQVWHLAYADTCGAYAIGTYKNDGTVWTIEQETECGMSQNKGFYHISENMQCRTGSVHFVLDPASVLWRTFRIYFNGTHYCLTGGTGDFATGWKNVMIPGGATAGRGNNAPFNFGWNLIPFSPEQGINQTEAPVVSVSYYNLMGMQVDKPESGVAIKRVVRADGTATAVKVLIK